MVTDQHDPLFEGFLSELSMPEGDVLDVNLVEGLRCLECMYTHVVNGMLLDDNLGWWG